MQFILTPVLSLGFVVCWCNSSSSILGKEFGSFDALARLWVNYLIFAFVGAARGQKVTIEKSWVLHKVLDGSLNVWVGFLLARAKRFAKEFKPAASSFHIISALLLHIRRTHAQRVVKDGAGGACQSLLTHWSATNAIYRVERLVWLAADLTRRLVLYRNARAGCKGESSAGRTRCWINSATRLRSIRSDRF